MERHGICRKALYAQYTVLLKCFGHLTYPVSQCPVSSRSMICSVSAVGGRDEVRVMLQRLQGLGIMNDFEALAPL
jgi:hypothetical protein